ncbi:MAG: hypothetical protein HY720_23425 [Planctomycetes bacterium]|nr:hypothetical protein [Planctomycetota bacterium]
MNETTTSFRAGGFALLELLVATAVLAVLAGALVLAFFSAQTTVLTGDRIGANAERSARGAARLTRDLEESGIAFADTSARLHTSAAPGNDWMANHFHDDSAGLSECVSSACPWNVSVEAGGTFEEILPRAQTSRNRELSSGVESVVPSGRVWRNLPAPLCPLDNSYAASGANLDVLLLFSPRDPGGEFVMSEYTAEEFDAGVQRKADPQGIVLYFPWYDARLEKLQIRRLAIYRSDLLAGAGSSSNWTAWAGNSPPDVPAMTELLDFGTDGTTDGEPDGWIPLTPALSDADLDRFEISSAGGASLLVREKVLSSSGWYKRFYLQVDRGTGQVYWEVQFIDYGSSASWSRQASFQRAPEVVFPSVVDFDFSTRVSNPYSAVLNPLGVSNDRTVRVTVVLDSQFETRGAVRHVEETLEFSVQPRNG